MKRIVLLAALVVFSLAGSAQEKKYAVVDFSVSYLRQQPDYESPLETQELMGTVVEVLATDSYWVQVKSPQPYVAWCTNKGLAMMDGKEIEAYEAAPKYICVEKYAAVLSAPDLRSEPLSDLVMGNVLRKAEENGKAVKSKGFLKVVMPSGKTGWVKKSALVDYGLWEVFCDKSADSIISLAKRFIGVPYLWGGMSPKGFDCSGLVRFCYMMNGVSLPRNASQQILLGEDAPLDSLLPGDLLFFGRIDENGKERVSHVGMYIGDGHFIHSSHLVRINSMRKEDPDCYENMHKLLRARRIL